MPRIVATLAIRSFDGAELGFAVGDVAHAGVVQCEYPAEGRLPSRIGTLMISRTSGRTRLASWWRVETSGSVATGP
jgi:hypothetical protein